MNKLLCLIPLLPLAGFLVNALLRLPKPVAGLVGCAGPIASFALSVAAFLQVPVEQNVFDWITVGTFRIPFGLRVDELTAVMILVVTGVGSLIHIYSIAYMHDDEGFSRFFAYLNLFMFAMLVLVMGDSIVLMFLGWEGVGLCSYLLIGFWYKDLKNADAGKKAFITNRIGDLGFILGIFCLWLLFGTLDFKAMAGAALDPARIVEVAGHPVQAGTLALAAALLLFVGACGKSAQIPLYVWLPDAMAGPTPVSALIHAATMVTAGVYMVGRMNFVYAPSPAALQAMALVAAATALLAGIIAVAQNDIKKVLAYSTVSQLGFMFAGMATAQFTTGMFHVVTHAFFKALLFLGAGAVIHALHGEQDIRKMGGLGKKLPLLALFFLAGSLALAGFPFTSGFMSKDAILAAVYQGGQGTVWLVLALTALVTAFYTTRLMILVFGPRPHEEHAGEGHGHHELHKPGLLMMAPLGILAVLSLGAGWPLARPIDAMLGRVWNRSAAVDRHASVLRNPASSVEARSEAELELKRFDEAALKDALLPRSSDTSETRAALERIGHSVHRAHALNMYLSFGLFGAGALGALFLYTKGHEIVRRFVEGAGKPVHALVSNKFYVDEIYDYLVVAPVRMGATVLWFIVDRILIDTVLVGGTGKLVYGLGWVLRKPHTGSVNLALGSFLVGALAMLAWTVFRLFAK